MPRKIKQLESDLLKAGFSKVKGGGKGGHRKFIHDNIQGTLIMSGNPGDDAQRYQEKQVASAIEDSKNKP